MTNTQTTTRRMMTETEIGALLDVLGVDTSDLRPEALPHKFDITTDWCITHGKFCARPMSAR